MDMGALIGPVISTIFSSICAYVVYRLEKKADLKFDEQKRILEEQEKNQKKEHTLMVADRLGTQCLLRDRLIQGIRSNSEKGYATVEDRTNMDEMYKAYHSLGGNGVITTLMEKFSELPVKPDNSEEQKHA